MACDICQETMQSIGDQTWLCPTCGSVRQRHGEREEFWIPKLIKLLFSHDDYSKEKYGRKVSEILARQVNTKGTNQSWDR